MFAAAAHITDALLPEVPVRQWVLSVPFELRLLLARNAAALSAVGRIFVREISRWQCEQAGASPQHGKSRPDSLQFRGGAICFPQRFGGSLNLNVHYHVVVPDGVFSRQPGQTAGAVFHQLPMPNRTDLEAIGHAVELGVLRWLRRRGLLDAEDTQASMEEPNVRRTALDACLEGSLGVGELVVLPKAKHDDGADEAFGPAHTGALGSRRALSGRGFDIHAAVAVPAVDREGRERLLRYCARAPLSLERLSVLEDGRVAYRVKNPRGRQTHRIMTPTQFLARLCALIPPPRHPLVRFHGVFAPHSSWRSHVVPHVQSTDAVEANAPRPACQAALADTPSQRAPDAALATPEVALAPMSLAPTSDARIDWATLLRRVHDIDALACPCGGRLRVIALITAPEVASAILTALHLPSSPPPIARARAPDHYDTAPD